MFGNKQKELEKQKLAIQEQLNAIQKENDTIEKEIQRKTTVREREKNWFEKNCQLYGWDKPIATRFFMMVSWIQEHPGNVTVITGSKGTPEHKRVSYGELIKLFHLEKLVESWQESTKDVPQTEPKYSE